MYDSLFIFEFLLRLIGFFIEIGSEWKIAIFSSLFASATTILGIYLTIKHNEKMVSKQLANQEEQYSESKRMQIMPFISYGLDETDETSHLTHENGGASFCPYGFVSGGNGPSVLFYSKMNMVNRIMTIRNVSEKPAVGFRALEIKAEEDATTRSLIFPFEIYVIEANGHSDMFLQTGIPKVIPEKSKYNQIEDIPINYNMYLDVSYGDILGNYYEQTITLRVFPVFTIYTDSSPSDFKLDMRIENIATPKFIKDKNIFNDKPKYLDVTMSIK